MILVKNKITNMYMLYSHKDTSISWYHPNIKSLLEQNYKGILGNCILPQTLDLEYNCAKNNFAYYEDTKKLEAYTLLCEFEYDREFDYPEFEDFINISNILKEELIEEFL